MVELPMLSDGLIPVRGVVGKGGVSDVFEEAPHSAEAHLCAVRSQSALPLLSLWSHFSIFTPRVAGGMVRVSVDCEWEGRCRNQLW